MNFLNVYKHLLPRARAWQLTIDKPLRQFFAGLAGLPDDVRNDAADTWRDIRPQDTRRLDDYEHQFALQSIGLTEQQRRDRLAAEWKATGGQSPSYIQTTLQGAGFQVYVHEWWVPTGPAVPGERLPVVPRNPFTYLRQESSGINSRVDCGEALAECGEAFAECGNGQEPPGYLLVNKVISTVNNYTVLCGEPLAECGEAEAECGEFEGFSQIPKNYIIPRDPARWPYFLYIGGETFGDTVTIDPKRREEFERLCLKICPAQQWLGLLIDYS